MIYQLFRDKHEVLSNISSYALKTVVMHLLKIKPKQEEWNEKHMGQRWLDSLGLLRNYLKDEHLPFYFDYQANLLHSFRANTNIAAKANWLDGVVKKLEESKDGVNCRDVWRSYF